MKVAVAGVGYVGLVTGVVLAHIGHEVTFIDVNEEKINKLKKGICPIYEKDLDILLEKNKNKLLFTTDPKEAYQNKKVIFIGVGTPEGKDGSVNLDYINNVCEEIKQEVTNDTIVVLKSTVPIGTNQKVEERLNQNNKKLNIKVVSNPEFLSQGTAIHDTLYATRIIIGSEDLEAKKVMRNLYQPLLTSPYHVPYLEMDRVSAEMVKYASNNFLALKISYINEIANFCEKIGADIRNVTEGMSYDPRIGEKFLKAGIGYGGSCFPKDTKALYYLSNMVGSPITTIGACIEVNEKQKIKVFEKLKQYYKGQLANKKIAILGVTFKPNTDDLRTSAALDNIDLLLESGALISAYDPIALPNLEKKYASKIQYANTIDEAIYLADAAMIMTEWEEIVHYDLEKYKNMMKTAVLFDGRNCYEIEKMKEENITYYCIGNGKNG